QYLAAGTYTASVTLTDSLGHSASGSTQVLVSPALTASAGAQPSSGTGPLSVNLSGSAGGGRSPYTYSWALGDGASSSSQNPSHVYQSAGTYTATLTVTDANGNTATASAGPVVVAAPLLLNASAQPSSADVGDTIAFNTATGGGATPYTLHWDFGDGATGSGTSPSHTYSAAGAYSVRVTLADAGGAATEARVAVTIAVPPTVKLAVSPPAGDSPLAVTLTASASGGTEPMQYRWDFGDGASLSSNAPSAGHSYSAGAYTASLTLVDATGHAASATAAMVVAPALVATANVSPGTGPAPLATSLDVSVSGGQGPYTYSWDFGDGSGSDAAAPAHVYEDAGVYRATVRVTDGNGGEVSSSVTVTVSAKPDSGGAPSGNTSTPGGQSMPTAGVVITLGLLAGLAVIAFGVRLGLPRLGLRPR
ncbi:MAG TPA: PKD domain-containing protein, partial [Candidatus Dormibacteraeota bacterium]